MPKIIGMPKKLNELKNLTIGQRQSLVLDAVSKNGLASISTVITYVADKSNISLVKKNVHQSFKKSIETDLKSFTGLNGKLGIKYYLRDSETEVPLDEIQENTDGSIKNIYNLKYYLIGGGIDVEGGKLLEKVAVKLFPPSKNMIVWKVGSLEKFTTLNKWHCVFKSSAAELISINCDIDSAPLSFIIGRFDESTNIKLESSNLGIRDSVLAIGHQSVSRFKDNLHGYHAKISINADYTFTISDNSSTGTYVCEATHKDCNNLNKYKSPANRTFMPKKDDLFNQTKSWEKVENQLTIGTLAIFLKFGEVVIFFGNFNKSDDSDG